VDRDRFRLSRFVRRRRLSRPDPVCLALDLRMLRGGRRRRHRARRSGRASLDVIGP